MMKKTVALMLCLLLMLATFAACSSGGSSSAPPAASSAGSTPAASEAEPAGDGRWVPEGPVSIQFATNAADDDRQKETWQKVFDAYNAHQPDVSLELVPIDWENHRTWLTMQLTGGTAPEVFHSKLPWSNEDYTKGLVRDLTPMYEAKNPYTDTEKWIDFFAPAVINQYTAAASNFASTCNFVNVVKVFYNKSMFEQAGVTTIPETWNEFLEIQQQLLDADFTPFAFPNSKPADNLYNWIERLFTYQQVEELIPELDLNDSGLVEANEIVRGIDLDIINITKEPFRNTFPLIKEWSQYWSQGYNAIDETSAKQMFIREEAALFMGFPTLVEDMEEMGATFEYGVFTFPYLTKENTEYACESPYEMGGVVAEVFCIPVSAEGEKLAAAEDFLRFLGSPEAMVIVAEGLKYMPTAAGKVSDALDGWEPEGKTVKMNLYGPAVDQKFADDTVMFGQLYIEERITLEEYLNEMQTSLKDMAERLKEANGWSEENDYTTPA